MSYGLVQPTRIGQKCHHPNDNGSANSVDTVKKFFGDERWKVLTMPSLFLWLQSDSEAEAAIAGETICKQRGHFNSILMRDGTDEDAGVMLMVFPAFPMVGTVHVQTPM